MPKELEIWQFIASRLKNDERVVLLVVAESTGSSPGRAGYKMAVGKAGELAGSIGGGVMEVRLVEQAKTNLSEPGAIATGFSVDQVHRKDVPNSSGMICSGRQTIIVKHLVRKDLETIENIIECLENNKPLAFEISNSRFQIIENTIDKSPCFFSKPNENEFIYQERLGYKHKLFIVGGGHCSLALSDLMSKMDFRISIFDDRPHLNTVENNKSANEIKIIDSYEQIGELIPAGQNIYVVVMTLGYVFDEAVIKQLLDHELGYFGVLGSRAKMKTLLVSLEKSGVAKQKLDRIHTPIGLPINSHTPEEIAISIAAEIISVKNA